MGRVREYDEVVLGTLDDGKLCGGTTVLVPANAPFLEDFLARVLCQQTLLVFTSTYINLPIII